MDIDDIFVAKKGIRMTPDDVEVGGYGWIEGFLYFVLYIVFIYFTVRKQLKGKRERFLRSYFS